jgi:DNA-binding transcriptional ArsR family regulator
VLRGEGMVATRREGKRIFYRIADQNVLEVLETLYRLYCKVPPCPQPPYWAAR